MQKAFWAWCKAATSRGGEEGGVAPVTKPRPLQPLLDGHAPVHWVQVQGKESEPTYSVEVLYLAKPFFPRFYHQRLVQRRRSQRTVFDRVISSVLPGAWEKSLFLVCVTPRAGARRWLSPALRANPSIEKRRLCTP